MNRRRIWLVVATASLVASSCGSPNQTIATATPPSIPIATTPSPAISADWPEYHRNAGRSGLGPAEPALGLPRVAWTTVLDGAVYASPLIVAGHVIVATENNTVYSLDLFSGAAVWRVHLGEPVDAATLPCGDIGPVTGITGTPAADPHSDRLYVVAYLRGRHHMLYALSLADGSVVGQQDVDPSGSTPAVQQQRGALTLASGYVYVPMGGLYGDCGPYHGYLEAVPTSFGAALVYRVPSARGASLWSAAGATIDANGDVYVVSGNGASRSTFDYSNAVIELSPDLQTVKSYFAPANWIALNAGDVDLGSVGATVVPAQGAVVAIGKEGVAYRMQADRLGGVGGQVTSVHVCSGSWGGTAWAGTTVFVPCADGTYALSLDGGGLRLAWHAPHPALGSPIVSAGVLWGIEPSTATLYALDPGTGSILYSASLGAAEHFSTPAATDGYVVAPAGMRVVGLSTSG